MIAGAWVGKDWGHGNSDLQAGQCGEQGEQSWPWASCGGLRVEPEGAAGDLIAGT